MKGKILFLSCVLGLLGLAVVFGGVVTGVTLPPALAEEPAPVGEHVSLGGGRYLAVLPAASTNLSPIRDTYVYSADPSGTYCGQSHLDIWRDLDEFTMPYYRHSFLGFNLGSIPEEATITEARLRLYQYFGDGASSVTIYASRVTGSWACPSWPGPSSVGNYGAISCSLSGGWKTWNITTLADTYWKGKSFGTFPNYGVKLSGPGSGEYKREFYSLNGSLAPYLAVTYYLPTATPTRTWTPTRTPTVTATPTATPLFCEYPLTVRTTDDGDDGACDSDHCSLREAINCANAHPGADEILFDIPNTDPRFTGSVWQITPAGGLPHLVDGGTHVNGASQAANRGDTNPAGPELVLLGSSSGPNNGFTIFGSGCTIRNMTIRDFGGNGVVLYGAGATGNTIIGNYIGVNASGSGAAPNGRQGVYILQGASNNTITANIISGNTLNGVFIGDTGAEQGNVVSNNMIGVNASGAAAIPNQGGVIIMHGAHDNTVGPNNVISGNRQNGVGIAFGDNNTVRGNRIGAAADGLSAMGNGRNGVDVADGAHTLIRENIIGANANGAKLYGGTDNHVYANLIGVGVGGGALPNLGEGLILEDGERNALVNGNTISGNGGNGIGIKDAGTEGNVIRDNHIGSGPGGVGAVPNGGHGVYCFDGVRNNTIGPGNLIAYNGSDGVRVRDANSLYNTITQNAITENGALGIENMRGGNVELPPPAIADFTDGNVSGTAALPGGAPCVGCTIEAFSDTGSEGRQYLGSTTTAADGSWTVAFEAEPLYGYLTATSTDTDGNTSEFPLQAVHFLIMEVELDKTLLSPDSGVAGIGEAVTFRITVRNTGDVPLVSLRISDAYPAACLLFQDAAPFPDTVDPVAGTLVWDDVTDHFGTLEPEAEIHIDVTFQAYNLCALGPLAVNCANVLAMDELDHERLVHWCEDVEIAPGPPEIQLEKMAFDPEVCVGDEAHFAMGIRNAGFVPLEQVLMRDLYDTTYLQSLNDPLQWGEDDGELRDDLDVTALLGRGIGPGETLGTLLIFRAKEATDVTVNEARVFVNGDPSTEQRDDVAITILAEAGPCEGNLILNGDFEMGLNDWSVATGAALSSPFLPAHTGARAVKIGLGRDEPDRERLDIVRQVFTIPADAHGAAFTCWVNVDTEDWDIDANLFSLIVGNAARSDLVVRTVDSHGWQLVSHDLESFIGETISVNLIALNDGGGAGNLWAYVDDVQVCVSRCGPAVPPPGWRPGMCWKDPWPDYAPSGVPDFDQRGYYADEITRTMDGPCAAANALWWLDSKFEPGDTPPPTISDGYPLVETDNAHDDHDVRSVRPLARGLAPYLRTDGFPTEPHAWLGTTPDDMAAGLRAYVADQGLADDYGISLRERPEYTTMREELLRCENVLLLLGMWEHQPDGWRRLGGHWVTLAGIDCAGGMQLAFSDPALDAAELGYSGIVQPTTGHGVPHGEGVHNDAAYTSHDIYQVREVSDGPTFLQVLDYVRRPLLGEEMLPAMAGWWGANVPTMSAGQQADVYQGGPIRTQVEYMVTIAPLTDTVTLALAPETVDAGLDEVFAVEVYAESRSQAFDTVQCYLDYDPAVLQVVTPGGNSRDEIEPLTPSLVLQNEVISDTGQINYAARVPLGGDPLTGRVLVARAYFRAVAPVSGVGSTIAFNWTTPRRTDILSGINSVLGAIRETRVRVAEPATVYGFVTLQGRPEPPDDSWRIPVTVELLEPTTGGVLQTWGAILNDQGRFKVEGVIPGIYDLRVKGSHTLAERLNAIEVQPGDNTLRLGILMEGDVDNDNDVDATDASLLNCAFGTVPGGANWDSRADLNSDEVINGVDMALLAANYGLTGANYAPFHPAALDRAPLLQTKGLDASVVALRFDPTPLQAEIGDVVAVKVMLDAVGQPVDACALRISYPTSALQVVDAAGNPAHTIAGSAAFDLELANGVDAAQGQITYAATMLGGTVTGINRIATIRFRVIGLADNWLRFRRQTAQGTDVTYRGASVLTDWPAAQVLVKPATTVRLPLMLKNGG